MRGKRTSIEKSIKECNLSMRCLQALVVSIMGQRLIWEILVTRWYMLPSSFLPLYEQAIWCIARTRCGTEGTPFPLIAPLDGLALSETRRQLPSYTGSADSLEASRRDTRTLATIIWRVLGAALKSSKLCPLHRQVHNYVILQKTSKIGNTRPWASEID
jgi:hypothetical protein